MAKFVRNPELVAAEMDGDLVMMSVSDGHYYGLGGIGPRIWALLETPRSSDEVVDAILSEYDVDAETCRRDVDQFLGNLLRDKLVKEID